MSKRNGRRLFSQKDGTTFKEDIGEISEEVKLFVIQVLSDIKEIGEDILEFSTEWVNHIKGVLADLSGIDWESGLFDVIANAIGASDKLEWLRENFGPLVSKITGIVSDGSVSLDFWLRTLLEFVNGLTEILQGGVWRGLNAAIVAGQLESAGRGDEFTARELNLAVEAFYNDTYAA